MQFFRNETYYRKAIFMGAHNVTLKHIETGLYAHQMKHYLLYKKVNYCLDLEWSIFDTRATLNVVH